MSRSRFSFLFSISLGLGVFTLGCAPDKVVDPSPHPAVFSKSDEGEATVDSLAKGLALAIEDVGIRESLRDALRDSPFPLHALQFASFLRGGDGIAIATRAAAALQIPLEAYVSMAESAPNLELVIPRMLDRTSWEGGAEIDVTSTNVTLGERYKAKRISEKGYDSHGKQKSVVTLHYSSRPYMILRPAEAGFPADAERVRAAAPVHARKTVTTPSEERASMRQRGREKVAKEKASVGRTASATMFDGSIRMMVAECTPETPEGCAGGEVPPPPPGVGGGATLSAEMTKPYCYGVTSTLDATSDRDNDRIRDDCESALAARLAPLLNIGDDDSYPARQPYWAVSRHPDRPDNIQIIYALSYLYDGGCQFCWLVPGAGPHEGDSEFIVLEVINSVGTTWGTISATLSAHFGAEEGVAPMYQSGADEYYWDDLDYPQGPFPRIWSSLDKHANYRNRAVCESGAFLMQDSCHGDYVGTQIPAPPWRNLGNYYHVAEGTESPATQSLDCTAWEGSPSMYYAMRTGQECFWSDSRFSGWDPAKPDDVTPYRRIFKIFGF